MTEPQVWVALGILLAFLTATLTIVTVQIGGLRAEMNARFDAVHDKFDARFDVVDARFDRVHDQIATLDRDVQTIAAKVFRED